MGYECGHCFVMYYLVSFLVLQSSCSRSSRWLLYLGLDARKSVFWMSDKVRFKPVSSATETGQKNEISFVASLDMVIFKTRITKTLIRLRGCAGWSASLLFEKPEDRFSRVKAHLIAFLMSCNC